jgi:hypothetical protein
VDRIRFALSIPAIFFRGRKCGSHLTVFLLFGGVALALALPMLVHREAGPDAWTLWTAYARADNCDFWSPLSRSRSSYECTAYILRPSGINIDNAWLYGCLCNLVLTVLPFFFFRGVSLSVLVVMLVWSVVRGFFLENLTKEILVGGVTVIILLAALWRRPVVGIIVAALAYGVMIRSYWVLVVVAWYGLVVIRPRLNVKRFLLILPVFYFCVALVVHELTGGTLTGFRQSSNEMRILGEEGARSLIVPLLSGGDLMSQVLDTLLVLLRLVFPVELIVLSGLQQAIFVALAIITTLLCTRAFFDHFGQRTALPLLAFPIAFLMIQAIFEPDFGSFARHFSMVAPIAFGGIGMWLTEQRKVW